MRALATPATVAEAVADLSAVPGRLVVAGGTDVVPELTAGRLDPPGIVALAWLREITGWTRLDGAVRVGAGLTCARAGELTPLLPALAKAASCVGGIGVRNAATVGGNLVSAAGGDLLPVLVAAESVVELAGAAGPREAPVADFLAPVGDVGAPDLRAGELVTAVRVPTPRGGADYARVAVRGAGAPALLTMAVVLDADAGRVRVALGVGGPVPARVPAAEEVMATDPERWVGATVTEVAEFARRVGTAAADADPGVLAGAGVDRDGDAVDAAGRRAYRRHAATVCAERLFRRLVGAPR